MSLRKRLKNIVLLPLFVFGVVAAQLIHVMPVHAAGNTLTWTGGGSDTKFSTAANWSTNTAPTTGDALVFPWISGKATINLVNDTNLSYASVLLKNGANGTTSTVYNLDTAIKLSGNATYGQDWSAGNSAAYLYKSSTPSASDPILNVTGSLTASNVQITGAITVSGDLTLIASSLSSSYASTISGKIYANGGAKVPFSTQAAEIVLNGGKLVQTSVQSTNYSNATPITIGNDWPNSYIDVDARCTYAQTGPTCSDTTYTLSGTVTMNANLKVTVRNKQATLKFTGTVNKNGNTIIEDTYSVGTIMVGSEAVSTPITQVSFNDNQPSVRETVSTGQIATLDGAREEVDVLGKGIIKGTGVVNYLYVMGKIGPGHSPGTITVLNSYWQSGGVYEAEILDKDHYDQIAAGKNHASSDPPAVQLSDNSELDVVLYPGWVVNKGDQFKIIDNQSSDPVQGTFAGLPEGTQFTVNGIVFNISYVGGDGNDVVLTALNAGKAAGTPNTGITRLAFANPIVVIAVGISAALLVGYIALKRRSSK